MQRLPASLGRFVAAVLMWLPATFALWYFAAPVLLWPVVMLLRIVAAAGFPDLILGVDMDTATLTFLTTLRPGHVIAGGMVNVDVNLLLYSFGLPLFAALTLAARDAHWKRNLLLGYALMLPFIAWGGLADFLKNVAITAGPQVSVQTGFVAWQRELIAFAFQFGSLILPSVVPAVTWVLLHRRFLERMRGNTLATPGRSGAA
jgi:hypothetical protein